jgi:hypothetical protein
LGVAKVKSTKLRRQMLISLGLAVDRSIAESMQGTSRMHGFSSQETDYISAH